VTFANRHALVYLNCAQDKTKKDCIFTAKVFTTHPGATMDLLVRIRGAAEQDLYQKKFTGAADRALTLEFVKTASALAAAKYSLELVLKSAAGDVLAQTSVPFEVR